MSTNANGIHTIVTSSLSVTTSRDRMSVHVVRDIVEMDAIVQVRLGSRYPDKAVCVGTLSSGTLAGSLVGSLLEMGIRTGLQL